jgi:signal transduction histidine kinase
MAFVTDITARVAAEQAARQGDRLAALGTLAAGLVHEINNPLGIMISRLDVMLMEAQAQGLSPGVAEDLRVLRRQADRVVGIARGLLSFSRESPGAREPVDLNRVVTETVRLADAHITKRGGRIVARLDPTLPTILGQASALQQVVLNLLSNAGDALGGGGEIRIDTGPAPGLAGAVRLRITDTGAGIEPETLPRIFDPFFTTKASGTGLGLSISYGIVREHQGIIDVESRPGRGTTFTLTFPTFGAAIA